MKKDGLPSKFFWVPIFISLGILGYFYLDFEPHINIYYVFGLIPSLLLYYFRRKDLALYAFAVLMGFIACIIRVHVVASPKLNSPVKNVWISAQVEEAQYVDKILKLTISNIRIKGISKNEIPYKAKLSARSFPEDINLGSIIVFKGDLMPPPPPAIPGGFDYRRFAFFQQIGAIGYATSRIKVKKHKILDMFFWERWRQYAIERISEIMMQPQASIITGMLLGDTSYLKQKIYEQIKIAGIAHVIAISGMHMVVVVTALFFSVRLLLSFSAYVSLHYDTKKLAAVLSIIGSLFYLMLVGNPISAQRAYLMSVIVLFAIVFNRRVNAMHSLTIACTILLLFKPECLLNASFQMSVFACFGLICGYRLSVKYIPLANGSMLRKVLIYFCNVVASTLIASIFTIPFIIYHFHNVAIYSVLANLVAIPLTDFILMPFGMLGLILMPLGMDKFVFIALQHVVDLIIIVVKLISQLPFSNIFVYSFDPLSLVLLSYGVIMIIIGQAYVNKMGWLFLAAFIIMEFNNTMPDAIVSSSGNLFVIKDSGKYYFSNKRYNRFVRKVWQDSLGIESINNIKSANLMNCSQNECSIHSSGNLLITKYLNDDKCSKYDIIINLGGGETTCNNAIFIGKEDLLKCGNSAIWLNNSSPKVIFANKGSGNRAWELIK